MDEPIETSGMRTVKRLESTSDRMSVVLDLVMSGQMSPATATSAAYAGFIVVYSEQVAMRMRLQKPDEWRLRIVSPAVPRPDEPA